MVLRLSFERNLCATLALSALVLKRSKRNEITVREKEGDVRREAAVTGDKLGSSSRHTSNDGRRR